MLMPPDSRIAEQILDVQQPASDAVDLVVARPVPVETPGNGDFVEIEGKPTLGVVDDQHRLGAIQGGPGGGAGEHHVFHLPGAQGLGEIGSPSPRTAHRPDSTCPSRSARRSP